MTELTDDQASLEASIEALLILSERAVSTTELAEVLGRPSLQVAQALGNLRRFYDHTRRGFELRQVGGGWRLWTRPEYADMISAWVTSGATNRLSQAALETLSIIAYLQPIARGRVSAIRGVSVDGVCRTLMARGLIEEVPNAESHAVLLATTDYFLERMGLGSLDELPPLAPLLPDAVGVDAELAGVPSAPAEWGGLMTGVDTLAPHSPAAPDDQNAQEEE